MQDLEWNASELLKTSGSYWQTCALHTAVKLDLFTKFGTKSLRADELAQELDGDNRALVMLLNALVAMDLLSRSDDQYANTDVSRRLLSKESDQYLGFIILHHSNLVDSWNRLDRSVLSGKPARTRSSTRSDAERESFLMGMFNMAMNLAPQIAKQIDLSGRRHLLDLGGGPGTYAIHFCLQNPDLRATLFDLPTTRPFAEGVIAKFALSERIGFLEGDYLDHPIGHDYDIAWLSHILHAESPETCQHIIDKTVAALQPGGMVLIHEFLLNDTMDGPLFPALFSLNMLLATERGQSYSEAQLRDMLTRAGVKEIRRLPFEGPNDSAILSGTV